MSKTSLFLYFIWQLQLQTKPSPSYQHCCSCRCCSAFGIPVFCLVLSSSFLFPFSVYPFSADIPFVFRLFFRLSFCVVYRLSSVCLLPDFCLSFAHLLSVFHSFFMHLPRVLCLKLHKQVCIHKMSNSPARLCPPRQKHYGRTERRTDGQTDGHTLL